MICHKTKLICAQIFIPHERPIMLVLREEEWLVGRPLLTEILGQADPVWSENADFQSIFARSASAITPSKKFN